MLYSILFIFNISRSFNYSFIVWELLTYCHCPPLETRKKSTIKVLESMFEFEETMTKKSYKNKVVFFSKNSC